MKLRIGLVLPAVLLLTILVCEKPPNNRGNIKGSWKAASKNLAVGEFNHVTVLNSGDLYIEVGKNPALRVEADDNLLPYLVTREANGKLELMNRPGIHLEPRSRIKYYLTVTNLAGITATDKGNVMAPDLEAERFSIVTSPAGDFTMGKLTTGEVTINPGGEGSSYCTNPSGLKIAALYAKELKVRNNTNENVRIAGGKVNRQDITINNDGNYEAPKVESATAEVRVNGSGSVTIRVSQSLNAYLGNYSGNVYYAGDPVITQTRQSDASGKLIKIRK